MSLASLPAAAQDGSRIFAGTMFGVSALSPDARAVTTATSAAVSLYDPGSGPAVNVFAGIHIAQYFSLQASWIWNRNDLALFSSLTGAQGSGFSEQHRHSHQDAVVLDGLIYFRRLDSIVRPYLGTGLALLHFSSREASASASGSTTPAGEIAATIAGLRSHVGIDVRLSDHVSFRYSFSETISSNPISGLLTPPGQHRLMNFQNLFGLVARF